MYLVEITFWITTVVCFFLLKIWLFWVVKFQITWIFINIFLSFYYPLFLSNFYLLCWWNTTKITFRHLNIFEFSFLLLSIILADSRRSASLKTDIVFLSDSENCMEYNYLTSIIAAFFQFRNKISLLATFFVCISYSLCRIQTFSWCTPLHHVWNNNNLWKKIICKNIHI